MSSVVIFHRRGNNLAGNADIANFAELAEDWSKSVICAEAGCKLSSSSAERNVVEYSQEFPYPGCWRAHVALISDECVRSRRRNRYRQPMF